MCLLDSETWSGLWPAVISSGIVVIGYLLQLWQFKRQSESQQTAAIKELEEQRTSANEQYEKQKQLAELQISAQQRTNADQLHLSIVQNLLTLALQKANYCNTTFVEEFFRLKKSFETANSKIYFYNTTNDEFNATISELVISSEQLNNAFVLFAIGSNLLSDDDKRRVVYAFWKQLSTDVRGLFCNHVFDVAIRLGTPNPKNVETYGHQLKGTYEFFNLIGGDMEGKPENKYNELVEILNKIPAGT